MFQGNPYGTILVEAAEALHGELPDNLGTGRLLRPLGQAVAGLRQYRLDLSIRIVRVSETTCPTVEGETLNAGL